jgi:hypothetical protein
MIGGWLVLGGAAVVAGLARSALLLKSPLRTHEPCDGKGCSFCNWQGKRAKRGAKTVGRMTGRPLPDKIR